MSSASDGMKMAASCVMFVTYKDGNTRTYYSRDASGKQKGNTYYWMNHLRDLCEKNWEGKVKEYAIYRCINGKHEGDPMLKQKYENV
jgi:hypothetical protein